MPDVTFRPLAEGDLRLLHRWLNDPAVVQWWEGEDVSWPAVVRDYGPGHGDPVEHWLALLDGAPLGWLQCYTAADLVDEETGLWADHLDLATTAGIDYLVGSDAPRGRGLGAAMIRAFVRDVVFAAHRTWTLAAAGPFEANVASWRALAKAGFRRLAVLDDEDGPCVLMAASPTDVTG
ncbi:MAG: GNAT family N-acetyltransferase [Bacteroidota bacterium]